MVDTPQVNALEGLLPHFEKTTGISPIIEIISQRYLFEQILQEHQDYIPSSDMYMFDIPWFYYLAHTGVLADLTDYIKDPSFDSDMFLPNCLKYFSEFEGKYYGLPFLTGNSMWCWTRLKR